MQNVSPARTGLCLAFLLLPAADAAADTIKFIDGRKAVGGVEVTDETLANVEYKRKSLRQAQQYAADLVAEVVYSDAPEEYELAQDNLAALAYEEAAQFFKLAAADAGGRKGLQAKCLFEAGEALRRAGKSAQAAATFDDLIQAQPESRYAPHAQLQRGVALAQSGDAKGAAAAFEKLKSEADAKGYGERWRHEADLQLLILNEKGDPAKALEAYQRLASQAEGRFPSVANQAKLRIGRVFVATKQFDKAKEFFQTILDNRAASSREIVAGAYNGYGAALRNKPGASDAELKQALYAHLRVVVSFGDVIDEQAEALYSAGKCFQRVPGEDSANRSRVMLSRCINEYPESPWALEARKG